MSQNAFYTVETGFSNFDLAILVDFGCEGSTTTTKNKRVASPISGWGAARRPTSTEENPFATSGATPCFSFDTGVAVVTLSVAKFAIRGCYDGANLSNQTVLVNFRYTTMSTI